MPQVEIEMSELKTEDLVFVRAIMDVRNWLNLKMRSGQYAFGFAVELASHVVKRQYDVHTIYDEIGVLEGIDTRPTSTKPATPFIRPPLIGLWHKHHHQARFLPKNLLQELHLPGTIEAVCAPHIGRPLNDAVDSIIYDLVIGAYSRRAIESRVTGEFIVYEPQPNGSNLYLTLGSHGDYAAIRNRVDAYKAFDQEQCNQPEKSAE